MKGAHDVLKPHEGEPQCFDDDDDGDDDNDGPRAVQQCPDPDLAAIYHLDSIFGDKDDEGFEKVIGLNI